MYISLTSILILFGIWWLINGIRTFREVRRLSEQYRRNPNWDVQAQANFQQKQRNLNLLWEEAAARFDREDARRREQEEMERFATQEFQNALPENIAAILQRFPTTEERLARGIWLTGEQLVAGLEYIEAQKSKPLPFGEYHLDKSHGKYYPK
jgi:hypothetical protein